MDHKTWKLIDILNLSVNYLSERSIENSRLDAELLIGHVLKMNRFQLYINFEKLLNAQEVDLIRALLKRRVQHEPIQYLTGEAEFYSLKFKVNHHTLIPRPETEILVEKIIEKCNHIFSSNVGFTVLDIGTGSGNIAICMAKYLHHALIMGIDIQAGSLKIAYENAKQNNVQDQIQFRNVDVFDVNLNKKLSDKFDVIVSNPPYISQEEFKNLPLEVKNYEPYIALNGGKNGLTFYHRFFQISTTLLKQNGLIGLEISFNKGAQLKKLVQNYGFKDIEVFNDLTGIERVIIAQKK